MNILRTLARVDGFTVVTVIGTAFGGLVFAWAIYLGIAVAVTR